MALKKVTVMIVVRVALWGKESWCLQGNCSQSSLIHWYSPSIFVCSIHPWTIFLRTSSQKQQEDKRKVKCELPSELKPLSVWSVLNWKVNLIKKERKLLLTEWNSGFQGWQRWSCAEKLIIKWWARHLTGCLLCIYVHIYLGVFLSSKNRYYKIEHTIKLYLLCSNSPKLAHFDLCI